MSMFIRLSFVCLLSVAQTVCAEMDDQALKEYLSRNFTADESVPWEKRSEFKTSRGVTDEQLHRVLMEIYKEASAKNDSLTPKTREWHDNRRTIEGVLGWLPVCGDIPVKDFLVEYAVAKENDYLNRSYALLSYLRLADAEESKTILLRFLVEEGRMDYMGRLSVYDFTRMIFKDATAEKKTAILNVLYIAVSDPNLVPWEFRVCDDILAKLSPVYEKSYQRFLLLKKHNAFNFPEKRMTTKGLLTKRLEDMEKHDSFYSISTNFTALKAHKFALPLNVGATNQLTMASPDFIPLAIVKNPRDKETSCLSWVGIALTGFAIASIGIWGFARRR